MPDLSNIQTYEPIIGSDFSSAADRFAAVLRSIGLWNTEIADSFAKAEWKEENGLIFSSLGQLGYYPSEFHETKIRPHICIYTPAVDDIFTETWMECSFLIESTQLRHPEGGTFYAHTYDLVKSISLAMHNEFRHTGVYFTDEIQDGRDFEGIVSKDKTRLWQFDYALIPSALNVYYADCPATHQIAKHSSYLEAWQAKTWIPTE